MASSSVQADPKNTGVSFQAASVTQFAYDLKGQFNADHQITDPLGHITTLTYTPEGLIATITDAQGNVTSYGYDLRGNRISVKYRAEAQRVKRCVCVFARSFYNGLCRRFADAYRFH